MSKPSGGPKATLPPALQRPVKLPPPITTTSEISEQAMKAGEEERKRLRGRRGRGSTILTRGFLTPARVQQAGLKTTLG